MRFAVISDTHIIAPGRGNDGIWWNRSFGTRTNEINKCMVATIASMEPDFVIHCGDFTDDCDMESWYTGLAIMEGLRCPWYSAVGNHDTWSPGIRDAFSARHEAPPGQCYHARMIGDLLFIFLDNCYWRNVDGSVSPYLDWELYNAGKIKGVNIPDHEIEWVHGQLDIHKDKTICLVSHVPLGFKPLYPVGTMPDGRPGKKGGMPLQKVTAGNNEEVGDAGNRAELRRVLSDYENIKLALAGHFHINDRHTEDGIAFIQVCSMFEWPFEFRMIEVDGDTVSVTTHGLSDPGFKQDSCIEERGNAGVAGESTDRTFSVKL